MKLSKQKAMECIGKIQTSSQNLVQDPRFARLHSDPRFQRAFKRKLKIPIDSRFRHIFSDKRFSDPLVLDKRGRKLKKLNQKNAQKGHPLQQYYRLSDEGDDDDEASQEKRLSESHQNGKQIKKPIKPRPRIGGDDDDVAFEEKIPSESLQNEKSMKHQRFETPQDGNNILPTKKAKKDLDFAASKITFHGKESYDNNITGKAFLHAEKALEEDSDFDQDETSESEEEPVDKDDSEESSDTDSSSSSSSDQSSDEEAVADSPSEEVEEEKVLLTENETRRLALVNMDWDHLRAVDILAVMSSFLPKGGQILSVTVFPSEFGLQQMKEEEKRGPQGLFQAESSEEEEEDAEGINMEKLRKYEKDKLRYYYAVVECDSKETADFLYKSCDGMEFERTSNTLDLRFIPDDMEFRNEPRDVANEVPADYQAPVFETRALQHSRVKLTWDDDEPDRVKTLHQKFNVEQLNEMDFKAYLASDASESEGGEDAEGDSENEHHGSKEDHEDNDSDKPANGKRSSKDKYRALLLGSEEVFEGKDKSRKDQDLEITFNSGLEELSKRLMDKTKQKGADETVWDAYLRKRKEKRKLQKQTKDGEGDNEDSADEQNAGISGAVPGGDAGFDDPFFKVDEGMDLAPSEGSDSERETIPLPAPKQKNDARAQKKAELEEKKREEERSKAELELLFADELGAGNAVKGYNLKKRLKEKSKKKDVERLPDKLPTVNFDDPRFSALFTSHRFAIDPTEPEFKRSAAQLRSLLEKQQKRLPQVHEVAEMKKTEPVITEEGNDSTLKRAKQELSMMVRALKRKIGAEA